MSGDHVRRAWSLESIFGMQQSSDSDSDVSNPTGVNMNSDRQLAAAYLATTADGTAPAAPSNLDSPLAAARAPIDPTGHASIPGFGYFDSAMCSPPPTNPFTPRVFGTQPFLQPILSDRQPTPPRQHLPYQEGDPLPDYRMPFTQQDFPAMPHANMPHHGPTPMQLAYAVPSALPPTHSNAAIGPVPSSWGAAHSIPTLGQAQGFRPAQPEVPPVSPRPLVPFVHLPDMERRFSPRSPGHLSHRSEEFYIGSGSLESASHPTSSEQDSEGSSEETSVLNCWGPPQTGSSEDSVPFREPVHFVYVDRPVYVDRIVHVPVYVRDVKVTKTVSCKYRPPNHDFPYHDPLPEIGCHFVNPDFPATTEIAAY